MTPLGYVFLIGGIVVLRQVIVGRVGDLPTDARDLVLAFLGGDMAAVAEIMRRRGASDSPSGTDGGPVPEGDASDYNLGDVKPHLAALVAEVAPRFGVTSVGGYRESARDPGGHPAGLAADFMVSREQGDSLAAYVRANAARLRVNYVIWRQRVWSVDRASEGWRLMEDRGSPTQNHMDHVHVQVKP